MTNARTSDRSATIPLRSLAGGTAVSPTIPSRGPRDSLTTIGKYRLIRLIGQGGMGEVYEAEQSEPVRRTVAVKLVAIHSMSREAVARFEAERHALARMDHPNIAHVIDAGTATDGRPYIAMEFVSGQPLVRYCEHHQRTLRERLELFNLVCRAVQHAHTKGVIHRDLKPSNVLVEHVDGQAVPKVIDFGVAKDIGGSEDEALTMTGQLLGTLLYMAPEQIQRAADVDTRADVYALGGMLYELLTGRPPIDLDRYESADLPERLRMVLEEEPLRPSLVAPATFSIPTELDWITLKALDKKPSRRYETASALADDVSRFLAHETVSACPPSARARLSKFVHRNRTAVFSSFVVVTMLTFGVTGTTIGMVRAVRAERVAQDQARALVEEHQRVAAARDAEAVAREDADRKSVEAQAMVQFLTAALGKADPRTGGRNVTVASVLAQAQAGLTQPNGKLPQTVRASLLQTIGETYLNLGLYAEARTTLELALEARSQVHPAGHMDTQRTRLMLGETLVSLGRVTEAVAIQEEALRWLESTDPNSTLALSTKCSLANNYTRFGRFHDAIPILEDLLKRRTAELGPDHPNTLIVVSGLANAYTVVDRIPAAIELSKQVIDGYSARQGPDHPNVIIGRNNLARRLIDLERFEEARPIVLDNVRYAQERLGPDHPNTLAAMYRRAELDRYDGRRAEAAAQFRHIADVRTHKLGRLHALTCYARFGAVRTTAADGPVTVITDELRTLVDELLVSYNSSDIEGVLLAGKLTDTGLQYGLADAIAPELDRWLQGVRSRSDVPVQQRNQLLEMIGQTAFARGRYDDAEAKFREILDRSDTPHVRSLLGQTLARRGMFDVAELLLLDAFGKLTGDAAVATAEALYQLYRATGNSTEADHWQRRRKELPPEKSPAPRNLSVVGNLGNSG